MTVPLNSKVESKCIYLIDPIYTLYSMSFLTSSSIASSSRSALRCLVQPRPTTMTSQLRSLSTRSPTKPSLNMASASGGPQDPLAYCSSLVQRLDPEAWLTSYFWKGRERAWFLAWRAFNVCPISYDIIFKEGTDG